MSSRKPTKKGPKDTLSVAEMLTTQRPLPRGTVADTSLNDTGSLDTAAAASTAPEASSRAILQSLAEVKGYLASAAEVKAEITAIGARTTETEHRVEQMVTAQNDTAKLSNTLRQKFTNLEIELEDISNRSRRNNLRILGLPDTVKEEDIESVLIHCFRQSLPNIPDHLWLVDRAHRALRVKGPKTSQGMSL
ncbi:Hypothetical predicted protein [Pelobates cultripes]|uniref:Uncharacterized protein n=1 Tax=Pelobates cultripes TaxID=61616 RepID=A0AAD1W1Q9_PELCU|nr:Hypothetical predicted protein [Pelobates cultripes]